uniref:Uncharacterized protein n=1 Tax=Hyaloperonospora arabidopsidis (strain Emoy2) TaxID=559515 RepID=M4BHD4_HYAAE
MDSDSHGRSVGRASCWERRRAGNVRNIHVNPAKYPEAEKERLMAICAAPVRDRSRPHLCAAQTMSGRYSGVWQKGISYAADRLRFQTTIQVQVEGELSISLVGAATINASRQHAQALQVDMLLAAEGLKMNLEDLHRMLSQCTVVPFRRRLYRLHNPHVPSAGSVWNRQVGVDGTRLTTQTEYVVLVYNVTRFMDSERLTAFSRTTLVLRSSWRSWTHTHPTPAPPRSINQRSS